MLLAYFTLGWAGTYPLYKDFKREFVARWEFGGGFEIDSDTITGWLRKRGVEVQP